MVRMVPRRHGRDRRHNFRREHTGGMSSMTLQKVADDCARDTARREAIATASGTRRVVITDAQDDEQEDR